MEQMQQGIAEIFYDNGVVFLATPQGDLPLTPYWKTFLNIGHGITDGGEVHEDGGGNWAFFDKEGTLLGVQMEDPVDPKSGAPRESALVWLRGVMEEHQVVTFVEAMKDAHGQHANEEPGDEGEVLSFQIGPEGPTGRSPANANTSTGRWLGRAIDRLNKATAAAQAAKNRKNG